MKKISFRKKVDFVLLFEKGSRELEVATLLKSSLENKGYSFVILQQNFDLLSAWKYLPKIVLLPFCYQNRSNNLFLTLWRKSKFVNLSWEQLFYSGNRLAKTPKGEFATKYVIHHSWSNSYTEYLIENAVPLNNIYSNGNLSLDLYNEPYRKIYDNPYDIINCNKTHKKILFSENFNWAFYSDEMLLQMRNDGQKVSDINKMIEYNNNSFNIILNWLNVFLLNHKDYLLVFRPRPATSIDQIKSKIASLGLVMPSNFLISKEGSVREWILYSDFVISTYSTTLIEAVYAEKKSFMISPIIMPDVLKVNWHKYITKANNYEEFEKFLCGYEDLIHLNNNFYSWISTSFFQNNTPINSLLNFLDTEINKKYSFSIPRKVLIYGNVSCKFRLPIYYARIFYITLCSFIFFRKNKKSEYFQDHLMKKNISGMMKKWDKLFFKK
jgi:surface carbohydrate biosynthesis protein